MKKRFLRLLLVMAMTLSTVLSLGWTASAGSVYASVEVCGQIMDVDNTYATTNANGEVTLCGTVAPADWQIHFDPPTGTLTLKNATLKPGVSGDFRSRGIVVSNGDCKIVVEGTNTITTGMSDDIVRAACIEMYNMDAYNLEICGGGTLNLITDTDSATAACYGIYHDYLNTFTDEELYIHNVTINITSEVGIFAGQIFDIYNANLTINSSGDCIFCEPFDLYIDNSTLSLTSTKADGMNCGSNVDVENSNITINADVNGIYADYNVDIFTGTLLNITAGYNGIYSDSSFIDIENITATITSANNGIESCYELYINGSELSVEAGGIGLRSYYDDVEIIGGKTSIVSADEGINADVDIYISAATMVVQSDVVALNKAPLELENCTAKGSVNKDGTGAQNYASAANDTYKYFRTVAEMPIFVGGKEIRVTHGGNPVYATTDNNGTVTILSADADIPTDKFVKVEYPSDSITPKVTLHGANIAAGAHVDSGEDIYSGIYGIVGFGLDIIVETDSTITVNEDKQYDFIYGINADDYLNISGNGKLTVAIDADTTISICGLYADDVDATINSDVTVTIQANADNCYCYAISGDEYVYINDCTINTTVSGSGDYGYYCGIFADDMDVVIDNATLNLSAEGTGTDANYRCMCAEDQDILVTDSTVVGTSLGVVLRADDGIYLRNSNISMTATGDEPAVRIDDRLTDDEWELDIVDSVVEIIGNAPIFVDTYWDEDGHESIAAITPTLTYSVGYAAAAGDSKATAAAYTPDNIMTYKYFKVVPQIEISFYVGDGVDAIAKQVILSGEKATKPADPTKTGFLFGGWYSNEQLTSKFDFDTPVAKGLTLYAKWVVYDATSPQTGDHSNLWLWFAVLFVSGMGFFGNLYFSKKKKAQ